MSSEFQYTSNWFDSNAKTWDDLVSKKRPRKILEIGSYEGRSACWLIEKCTRYQPIEIHCIDSWQGGMEHDKSSMGEVESRFDHNISVAIKNAENGVKFHKHKSLSNIALAKLIADGMSESFDFVYIDGSHQAPDVLIDCTMSFQLLEVGALIIFDDYLGYTEETGKQDSFNMVKPGVDAFLNIFQRKVVVMPYLPIYQLYALKTSG